MQQIADDGEGNRIDDMDPMFDGYDPDDEMIPEANMPLLSSGSGPTRDWLSRIQGQAEQPNLISYSSVPPPMDEDAFDDSDEDLMPLEEKLAKARAEISDDDEEFNKFFEDSMRQLEEANINDNETADYADDDDLEGLIDESEFDKMMKETMLGMDDTDDDTDHLSKVPGVASNDYSAFRAHLVEELREEGSNHDVNEEETRQLFDMMRTHFIDSTTDMKFSDSGSQDPSKDLPQAYATSSSLSNGISETQQHMQPQLQVEPSTIGFSNKMMYADDFLEMMRSESIDQTNVSSESSLASVEDSALADSGTESSMQMALQRERILAAQEDEHITELKELLPGLPLSRIEKIADEFQAVLGYPSVMKLALALRENMPDEFGPQCLTKKNLMNAKHVYAEAEKDEIVDIYLINAMLQVYTNSGRIEPAIRFYETEFENHGLVSDNSRVTSMNNIVYRLTHSVLGSNNT